MSSSERSPGHGDSSSEDDFIDNPSGQKAPQSGDQGDNRETDDDSDIFGAIEKAADSDVELNPASIDSVNLSQDQPSSKEIAGIWRGPWLPPGVVRQYDTVVHNGAERVFVLTEKEQDHRHKCEDAALELDSKAMKINEALAHAEIKRSNAALFVGSLLAFIAILGGLRLIDTGKQASGVAAVATPAATILIALVGSKKSGRSGRSDIKDE